MYVQNQKKIFDDDSDDLMVTSKVKTITHIDVKDDKQNPPSIQDDIIYKTFNEHFPDKTIKQIQYDIVKSIMEHKDVIAILPTGYGKSMCYQLPFLIDQTKIVMIISPLISLMEDQKSKLEAMGMPVACFHSNVNKNKKKDVKASTIDDLTYGDDPFIDEDGSDSSKSINTDNQKGIVIFVTPEYIVNCENWIRKLSSHNRLSLIAIDEAHCISSWGHDFRPEYQGLYRLKEWLKDGKVPVLALTATATKHVEGDIKTFLELDNPQVFKTSFDRPNLSINVLRKPNSFKEIFPILDKYNNDFTIIYCKTRDKAEEVCELLKENDYNADVYHAGLNATLRQTVQDKFANRETNIIVATIAFGMGIDQTIHLVVHWGCPSDMESYYQEIGRAGRDGVDSDCYLYFDKEDTRISRYFLKTIVDKKYHMFRDEQISKMERFCMLPQCRRKLILKHFGEDLPDDYACNKCDNCKKQNEVNNIGSLKLIYPIYIIIKTIFTVKCKLGANKVYLITKGSKSKIINEFNKCVTYGLLKDLSEDQIKKIIQLLVLNKYLREKTITSGFGTILETTPNLVAWYSKIYYASKDDISYDVLQPILQDDQYKLDLNIPIEFNNIINVQMKTTFDVINDAFDGTLEL
jgi:ATP-dependent DNA helicase RecQ